MAEKIIEGQGRINGFLIFLCFIIVGMFAFSLVILNYVFIFSSWLGIIILYVIVIMNIKNAHPMKTVTVTDSCFTFRSGNKLKAEINWKDITKIEFWRNIDDMKMTKLRIYYDGGFFTIDDDKLKPVYIKECYDAMVLHKGRLNENVQFINMGF